MMGGLGATVISIIAIVALLALARFLTNWIADWWE
jgi:hypothetical protein